MLLYAAAGYRKWLCDWPVEKQTRLPQMTKVSFAAKKRKGKKKTLHGTTPLIWVCVGKHIKKISCTRSYTF